MSDYKAKMHQIRFLLKELTPQTLAVLRGLLLGEGGDGKGRRY